MFAQDYSATPDAGEAHKYSLCGTVVNSVTGAPLPRALVTLFSNNPRSVLTTGEGHFEFGGLASGQYSVGAEKPGFFGEREPQMGMNQAAGPPLTVMVGPEASSAVVRLVPESVIAGRITEGGVGVEGVPVTVLTPEIQDGFRQWTQRGNSVSDEDGEFRVANLTPGEYYLEMGPKPPDGGLFLKGLQTGYGRVFYPGPPTLEGGAPLSVGTGQRAEVEVAVKREPWFVVSGVVKTTEPGTGWNLQLMDSTGNPVEGGRNNAETGEFVTRAPAGNYTVRVQGYAPNGPSAVAEVPLTVHSDLSGVQVALGPGISIALKVKTEPTGTKAEPSRPQMRVNFGGRRIGESGMPPVSVSLRRTGEFDQNTNQFASPDASGKAETLALRGLAPGTYWLEVSNNYPWYVQSAECGGVDLLKEKLTVTSGAPCAEIDIVLRDDGATLHVTGSWEGGPAQAMVLLMPERAPQQTIMGQISKDGDAGYGNLAPGTYNVLVLDRADDLEYKNPEAMSGYLSRAGHVTLSAGQESSLKVEMVRR